MLKANTPSNGRLHAGPRIDIPITPITHAVTAAARTAPMVIFFPSALIAISPEDISISSSRSTIPLPNEKIDFAAYGAGEHAEEKSRDYA
jgi:hypothetical protein